MFWAVIIMSKNFGGIYMYKNESTLGLVGSVIAAVFTFLFLVGALLTVFLFGYLEPMIHDFYNEYATVHINGHYVTYESLMTFGIPFIAACAAAAFVVAVASFILGFLGTSKLNRNDRNGGVLLIVGGALALISVVGFIPFILMLIGGIMALSKKPVSVPSEFNKTA